MNHRENKEYSVIRSAKILGFLCAISLFLLISGCREPELNSKWLDREINIDGLDNEWQDNRLHYDEVNRALIGVYNDKQYLYLRLSSRDKTMQRKILWLGLTVWFDNKGGKEKRFGIRYPLGTVIEGQPIIPDIPGKGAGRSGMMDRLKKMRRSRIRKAPDHLSGILEGAESEPILLGPDENDRYIMFDGKIESLGIIAKVDSLEGNFVYELKVPLKQNERTPYAVGIDIAGKIGIGFETGKMDRKKMGGRRGSGSGMEGSAAFGREAFGGKGGRDPGSGGHGKMKGNMRGKRGDPGGEMIKQWELWIKVQLAAEGK
jgi:hypothetical protein